MLISQKPLMLMQISQMSNGSKLVEVGIKHGYTSYINGVMTFFFRPFLVPSCKYESYDVIMLFYLYLFLYKCALVVPN